MNKINTIYTTVSNGRTHIAADDKYLGSVSSYNNCFTQLFAWIFRQSMTVHFDGKARSVNKDSYRKLLLSLQLQNNKIQNVRDHSLFRKVAENAKLPSNSLKMRDMIAQSDQFGLARKLAEAISTRNTKKALLMIGKGAALDIPYYERTGLSPAFYSDTDNLNKTSRYAFTVTKAPPILQASLKANATIVQRLKEAGAPYLNVTGQQYTFQRTIVDVQRHVDFGFSPVIHHHYGRRHGCHGGAHIHYRPEIREHISIRTEDNRTPPQTLRLENPA